MTTQRALVRVVWLAASAFLPACFAPAESDTKEFVCSNPDELAAAKRTPVLHFWWHGVDAWWQHPGTDGKYTVPMCWVHVRQVQDGTGSGSLVAHSAADDAAEAEIIAAARATWEASSAVKFDFKGDCPSQNGQLTDAAYSAVLNDSAHATWVPVALIMPVDASGTLLTSGSGGLGWPGYGNRNPAGASLPYPDGANWWQVKMFFGTNRANLPAMTAHEFGHMLGWEHEFTRADYAPNYTPVPPETPCNPPTPNDGETNPKFTPADADSIMALWECSALRHVNPAPSELTYYDALGASIAYPVSFTRRARGRNGFITSAGLLVRQDDFLRADWTHAGALDAVYQAFPRWVSGTFQTTSREVAVSSLGSSVSFSFRDFADRLHNGSEQLIKNNSAHAALALTTITTQ